MKFKINRDHFSNGLQMVLSAVSNRAPQRILTNVMIEASEDKVTLSTTNLDIAIRCQVKAEVLVPGGITLPARKLAMIVKDLPSLDVNVQLAGSTGQQVKIESGSSRFTLLALSKDEFPPIPSFPEDKTYLLPQAGLSDMIRSVAYAQSTDETRAMMNSVFFQFENATLTVVATDGRRLAVAEREVKEAAEKDSVILPGKTAGELLRMLGQGANVRMAFNMRQAAFVFDTAVEASGLLSLELVSKALEGTYPNFRQVVPKTVENRFTCDRELLLDNVRRAAIVSGDDTKSVIFAIEANRLEISATSSDLGEGTQSMAIEYAGPKIEIKFNANYLMDPLKNLMQDKVIFEFKDSMSPSVMRTHDRFLCVIMPLRIS